MKIDYRKIGLKKIDVYIIKKFLGTFFFSIVLILSIAVIFDLTEKLDNFFDNNAPLKAIIFDYYLNFIPFYMNMFTPLFTFISVIFFTSKLASNTEIIAMLASGISFRRIMKPYFISAAIISLMSFVLGGYIIPPSNEKLLEFEDAYIKKFKTSYARNIQMEIEPGVILYIERFEISQHKGYRFSLEKFDGKILTSRLTAETITWDSLYHWQISDYLLRNFDGMRESIVKGPTLDTTITVQPTEFFITAKESAQLNNTELKEHLDRLKNRGIGSTQAFEDEYYKRFSMPLAAFIMTLMGVSLASRKVRGGIGLHLGVGLALSSIYILFSTLSTSFSVSGVMSPFLAVWLPNLLFLGVGAYLYHTAPK
ncbi:MAG: LptF/LptG family permease [Paludibacter sp.]|nr:LptF/LptG family permease [Paludibacter sp.]MDD4198690.1 LptF/LptG family permease [Paludibacter sp.]MDD4427108.1 LptF/LptG family permease [Paludibacter sp.]